MKTFQQLAAIVAFLAITSLLRADLTTLNNPSFEMGPGLPAAGAWNNNTRPADPLRSLDRKAISCQSILTDRRRNPRYETQSED